MKKGLGVLFSFQRSPLESTCIQGFPVHFLSAGLIGLPGALKARLPGHLDSLGPQRQALTLDTVGSDSFKDDSKPLRIISALASFSIIHVQARQPLALCRACLIQAYRPLHARDSACLPA
ncbi:hypothetical protein DNJ95_02640 [Stutzerimonas kirkiae]|uniref:Uncharacterized protein n=1 Tax=Stutzerimonas kirkiae TaxID=2211392 RepID=A0A4Q9RG85_9GAMM|nr:hypothetical protein DNJ96_01970 [Stutzerimonas kirkiae]TBV05779.1 hypothetical protein DNJ95_02640 [Stutzerimonas kirkiae]TBV09574.1 hypothetical protein DNK08_09185 [Stutzerimonas kirkiae]